MMHATAKGMRADFDISNVLVVEITRWHLKKARGGVIAFFGIPGKNLSNEGSFDVTQ